MLADDFVPEHLDDISLFVLDDTDDDTGSVG
jgi:hypothetical protein